MNTLIALITFPFIVSTSINDVQLRLPSGSNCPLMIVVADDIVLKNLYLDGNKDHQTKISDVLVIKGKNVLIENVVVCNGLNGVNVLGSVTINGLNSYSNTNDGVLINSKNVVMNSIMHSNDHAGLTVTGDSNRFSNIVLENNLYAGVFINGGSNNIFNLASFKYSGIYIGLGDDNIFFDISAIPIYVNEGQGNRFFRAKK